MAEDGIFRIEFEKPGLKHPRTDIMETAVTDSRSNDTKTEELPAADYEDKTSELNAAAYPAQEGKRTT